MKRFTLPFLLLFSTLLLCGAALGQQPGEMPADSVFADSTAADSALIAEDTTVPEPVEEPVSTAGSAQDIDSEEEIEVEEGGLFSDIAKFFRDGGPAMWAILVFLAAGVAIAVERFIFLFTIADMKPEKFMGRIAELIRKGSIEGAIASCADKSAPLARIIEAALRNYRNTERDIQNAVDEMALAELPRLNARTGYLATLANVSTMVGLLGTIFGLIAAFEAVGAADPAEKSVMLANGISMAMNTTAFGLISAIPLLLAHSFLTAKTDSLVDDIDRYSVMVINMLAQARKEA
ncbi:MAG: MotA/TolQ/ExbB proton channel family protein [Candidatus Fermentibacteraceae bacterium]|nr:MotA/TolQ/ExbB proton channel family protein [Candidatus Fermentibacteraceae bacterium]MBN2608059.1 MotA/TolQ/ExbB proton channel family protein [Candidatus Fermentibacteraceae bacterium]